MKVWNGAQVVDSTAETVTKYAVGTLTFTGTPSELKGYFGSYTVYVAGSDLVRVGTSLSNGAVGTYNPADPVEVGTITIDKDGAITTYASVLFDDSHEASAGLHFYVSITPDNTKGEDTKSPGESYGKLTATLSAVK